MECEADKALHFEFSGRFTRIRYGLLPNKSQTEVFLWHAEHIPLELDPFVSLIGNNGPFHSRISPSICVMASP